MMVLPEDMYTKQLFNQKWNIIKPRSERKKKGWRKLVVGNLFKYLCMDKGEWLEVVLSMQIVYRPRFRFL